MSRSGLPFAVLLLLTACASSRQDGAVVRLTTEPSGAQVLVDCGRETVKAQTPVDFVFPNGPNVRCDLRLSRPGYADLETVIDRETLVRKGVPGRTPPEPGPMVTPVPDFPPRSVGDVVATQVWLLVEGAARGVRRLARNAKPDVYLNFTLEPLTR